MKNQTDPRTPAEENDDLAVRRRRFIREVVGIVLGASGAMVVSSLVPAIRENVRLGVVLLWGGAIGGLLASYERFERAGAALTKGENRVVNYIVGIGVPVGVLIVIYFLIA